MMNMKEFQEIVKEKEEGNPIMFGLPSDNIATAQDIEMIERYYSLVMPICYKQFIQKYGGGYFAFIVVYSLDENSPFFIKRNVTLDFIDKNKYLPVIDLETGDTIGFRIVNGICDEKMAIYNHEKKELNEIEMDFYNVILKYGLNIK